LECSSRDREVSSGDPGDCGGRSSRLREEVGRSDERRGWVLDRSPAVAGMRVAVGVVALEGPGEGDCSAEGDDMRFTRAMRERSFSWRALSWWRGGLGALSAAMCRNRSSLCSSSVSDVLAVAAFLLCAGAGRAPRLLGGLESESLSDDDSSMELAICGFCAGRALAVGVRWGRAVFVCCGGGCGASWMFSASSRRRVLLECDSTGDASPSCWNCCCA
jgi:hypothetical protein